jgi:hypothetical protein
MKNRTMIICAIAGAMTLGTTLRAEDPSADLGGAKSIQGGQNLTPEERAAKQKAFQAKLEELRKKKADGSITDEESEKLARMEEMSKRFTQGGANRKSGPDAQQGRQRGPESQAGGQDGPGGGRGGPFQNLSPEERDAKMKELSAKGEQRLANLIQKKKEGKLSEEEAKQFTRLAAMAQMMSEGFKPGEGRGGRPPGDQPPQPPADGK